MTNINNKREYLSNIDAYLLEIELLTKKSIDKSELSSINEVDEIRSKASNLKTLPKKELKIDFSEKTSTRFIKYIQSLYYANNNEIYLWTSKTNVCGLYKVSSIKDINFSFPFDINNEGMFVLLSVDLKDKLLFDFSFDSSGKKIIEIEIQGLNWPSVEYPE